MDELRYMERKGFLKPGRVARGRWGVRHYADSDVRKVQLITKYRQQGFTWNIAVDKARYELENPSLF